MSSALGTVLVWLLALLLAFGAASAIAYFCLRLGGFLVDPDEEGM